jgi:triosephosphate isomerase
MSARRPLIAGNWKMNLTRGDARRLAVDVATLRKSDPDAAFDMLVCPPFTMLEAVSQMIEDSGVYLGGQTCHFEESGAHTGDISAPMLADVGCTHVILGHSERRTNHGETNELVKKQAESAHNESLITIICVGETEEERESGKALETVTEQVLNSIPENATYGNTVIAYEPVWAIGTGKVATPDDVQEMHQSIRETLKGMLGQEEADGILILYGGSMKPSNAKDLLALADVDGGLIGGASLKPEDFWEIAESCPSN